MGFHNSNSLCSCSIILPGEKAPSHRHSQNALRFITEGKGAYTIVQGERVFMEEGDFLITPKNLWHGHEHIGTKPMIWTDALDIPTFMQSVVHSLKHIQISLNNQMYQIIIGTTLPRWYGTSSWGS